MYPSSHLKSLGSCWPVSGYKGKNMIQVSGFLLVYCLLPLRLVFGWNRETDTVVEFMMAGYINARGKKKKTNKDNHDTSFKQGRKHESKSLLEN